jgi:hypothetical protein
MRHTWPESRKVRDWLFVILRFAVTLEPADRAAVMALAEQMDRLGYCGPHRGFSFFVRTSTMFCDGIVASDDPEKFSDLRRCLSKIDDHRLRWAFEAVLRIERIRSKAA